MIQTVNGWIKKEEIGFCHSHEHLFLADGVPATVNPALRIDDYRLTVKELERFKEIGGNTIIDAQPLGCGRMEQKLIDASNKTNIAIVAATGFHKLMFYDPKHWIFRFDEHQLKNIFIHELNQGMFIDTDMKEPDEFLPNRAGFIKVAIDEERLHDKNKKWFEAAAEASLATGFPIMCHTESKEQALYIAEYFLDRGIIPANIILCHLDRTLNQLDIHIELAKLGLYLEYDTIGRFKYHSDEEEADLIVHMLDAGMEDNILVGLDTTRERLKSYGAEIGLDHLQTAFIPLLKNRKVSDKVIHKMITQNPGLAFSNKK